MERHLQLLDSRAVAATLFGGFLLYLAVYVAAGFTTTDVYLQTTLYVCIAIAAFGLCVTAWWKTSGHARNTWLYLSLGVGGLLSGQLAWMWYEDFLGVTPPLPSVTDLLSISGSLLLFVGILSIFGSHFLVTRLMKARYLLDISIITLAGLTLVMTYVMDPVLDAATGSSAAEVATWAAYPVVDTLLLASFAALVLGFRGARPTRWHTLVIAGIVFHVAGDLAWAWIEFNDWLDHGTLTASLLDSAWLLGYFLFGMAALEYLGAYESQNTAALESGLGDRTVSAPWWDLAVPFVALTLLPIILVRIVPGIEDTPFEISFFALICIVGSTLVVVRSALLSVENRDLASKSVADPLTGLYNHRFFHERASAELSRADRAREPLSLALLDLDRFADVNNMFGHQVGDRYLGWVAEVLRDVVRTSDLTCRVGGDEFGLIMPSTTAGEAREVCQRLCDAIKTGGPVDDSPVSFSVGIATYPEHGSEAEGLIAHADGALYWAKHKGRDTVVVFDTDTVEYLSAEARALRIKEQSYLHMVEVLAAAVDARDSYTQDHSRNVASLARRIAQMMGLSERHVSLIESAGLLHDVGKIGIPDAILRKTDELTSEEKTLIRRHPELSRQILCAAPFTEVLPWILSHHERWDGNGYPAGLCGDEIPVEARILTVSDAFDAMISDRPYRKAMTVERALDEMRAESGTQFDPEIVDVLLRLHMNEIA